MFVNNPGKIILGARSSIFLPFNDLKLIIIDEEHENAYKQFNPFQDIMLVIVQFTWLCCIVMKALLGSATPCIESYFNAISNKYNLI